MIRSQVFRVFLPLLFISINISFCFGQENLRDSIRLFKAEKESQIRYISKIDSVLEKLKLRKMLVDIMDIGLPHGLEYRIINKGPVIYGIDPETGQTRWSMHIISSDIYFENRVQDHVDLLASDSITGNSEKIHEVGTGQNGTYDTIQMVPQADFSWSPQLLKNIACRENQILIHKDVRRTKWSELESKLRAYLARNKGELFVITGVLYDEKQQAEFIYKAALDLSGRLKRGIAFLLPTEGHTDLLDAFAVPIDSIEKLTKLDLFPKVENSLQDSLESSFDLIAWLGEQDSGDVNPLTRLQRPAGTLNTIEAQQYSEVDRDITVCGTVVSATRASSNHIFLNLDKAYPNQIFTVGILSREQVNFSYDPVTELTDKAICVTGELSGKDRAITMFIKHEKKVKLLK